MLAALSSVASTPVSDDPRQLFAQPCAPLAAQSRAGFRAYCAPNDSVIALQYPVDAHVAHRINATRLWDRPAPPSSDSHTEASVAGDFIVVEHTSCPTCRRVMGTTWMFRPAQAPAEVLTAAQSAAGLPTTPLLRSVAAWRAAR